MSIDTKQLLALPPEEQLQIVELLWDHLSQSKEPIPWPEWIVKESHRRLDEMRSDPTSVMTHDEVWQGIANRHG